MDEEGFVCDSLKCDHCHQRRHTRIYGPYNQRTVALELFDELQQSGFGPPGFKDCHLFIISAAWPKVAERCSKVCLGSTVCYYIFHCYTIVTLHCPPKLPYAVTHPPSDFAHLFPEPAT